MAKQTSPQKSAVCQNLRFLPLTPDAWSYLERLFGPRGASSGCWCMYWRVPKTEYEQGKGAGNRESFHRIVDTGDPPGILALAQDEPIGWCAIGPRQTLVRLEQSRALRPLDDAAVWSIACLFVRKDLRRHGVSAALLNAAAEYAFCKGAGIVEGYPTNPRTEHYPEIALWTGTMKSFQAAGFQEAGKGPTGRSIMRRTSANAARQFSCDRYA